MNNHTASLEITVNVHESVFSLKFLFLTSIKHLIKYHIYVKFPRIFAHNVQCVLNIGLWPSDHYFRRVCLSVCLFVCAEFFSAVFDPVSIKL